VGATAATISERRKNANEHDEIPRSAVDRAATCASLATERKRRRLLNWLQNPVVHCPVLCRSVRWSGRMPDHRQADSVLVAQLM
jgi:hypothetical protein